MWEAIFREIPRPQTLLSVNRLKKIRFSFFNQFLQLVDPHTITVIKNTHALDPIVQLALDGTRPPTHTS